MYEPSRVARAVRTKWKCSKPTREYSEEAAVRAVLERRLADRLRIAGRAALTLARDPEDTKQVFLLGIALNTRKFPEFFTRIAADDDGLKLLVSKPHIDSAHVDYDWLRSLPDGTLGREYVRFLDERDLDPDIFEEPKGLPDNVAFIARRMRQSHDIWHVITGFGSDVAGEIGLQAFTFAQTRMPSALLIACIGALRYGTSTPRLFADVVRGYLGGRRARFLPVVAWEELWERDIVRLRDELGIAT